MPGNSLDAKSLTWYVRDHLNRGAHKKLAQESAQETGRTEAAQYQFLSNLMNRDGPFNANQRQRLHEEFQIQIEDVRELYHARDRKKNADNNVTGDRNIIGDKSSISDDSGAATEYLLSELDYYKDHVHELTRLLAEKEKQLSALIEKLTKL